MASLRTELTTSLTRLRLPSFRASFEHLARQAELEKWTYEQYLLALAVLSPAVRRLCRQRLPQVSRSVRIATLTAGSAIFRSRACHQANALKTLSV